jgi:hypothetical protein
LNAADTAQLLQIAVDGAVVVNVTVPEHSFNTFKLPQ